MTTRFQAEEIIRNLASGDIPDENDVIIRNVEGWVFESLDNVFARFQQSALTAVDSSTVDGIYGSEEQGVIQNNRTRISEIEAVLQAISLLP